MWHVIHFQLLGLDLFNDAISNGKLALFCGAFKESTWDRLKSLSLGIDTNMNQDNFSTLLKTISNRWPSFKHLKIYSQDQLMTLEEDQLCELIGHFTKLETLLFENFECEPIISLAPFPSTRSIKKLCLGPFQPAISLLFPSVQKWTIESVYSSDLYLLASIDGQPLNGDMSTLEVNMLSFEKSQSGTIHKSIGYNDKAFNGFSRFLRSFPKLRSLHVLGLEVKYRLLIQQLCLVIIEECPHLEKLTLKNTSSARFEPSYFRQIITNLKLLAVGPCDLNSLESFQCLMRNSPKLRSLRISRGSDAENTDEIQSLIDVRRQKDPDFITFDW